MKALRAAARATTAATSLFAANKIYDKRSEQHALAAKLNTQAPSWVLASVMKDHGYDHREQVGLMALMQLHGIDTTVSFVDRRAANDWLKEVTQKHLLRRGAERWSKENEAQQAHLAAHHDTLLAALDVMGMLSDSHPNPEEVGEHVALILGALDTRVHARVGIMEEALERGLVPDRVVAVTGHRELRPSECPDMTGERTEARMMREIWDKCAAKNPVLAAIPFEVSEAELKPGQRRSTTVDTGQALARHPLAQSGTHFVTHLAHPYARRLNAVMAAYLLRGTVFSNAKGLDPSTASHTAPDEVARHLYGQHSPLSNAYQDENQREMMMSCVA